MAKILQHQSNKSESISNCSRRNILDNCLITKGNIRGLVERLSVQLYFYGQKLKITVNNM